MILQVSKFQQTPREHAQKVPTIQISDQIIATSHDQKPQKVAIDPVTNYLRYLVLGDHPPSFRVKPTLGLRWEVTSAQNKTEILYGPV